MSWIGATIGPPCAGENRFCVDSIRIRASACAVSESGTCTAIWSPSKSALKAWQTSGCTWIAFPSTSTGSNAKKPKQKNKKTQNNKTKNTKNTHTNTTHTNKNKQTNNHNTNKMLLGT